MNKVIFLLAVCMAFQANAFNSNDGYAAKVDLNNVVNDRVQITIDVPPIETSTVIYCLPKIVPGTYSIYDFGRFVYEFTAYDDQQNLLPVVQLNDNEWQISNAEKLDHISYWVDDSYDMTLPNPVFEPAGTNIESGKNYLLNTFGMIGYITGMKSLEYELSVYRPSEFYGVTPLRTASTDAQKDVFHLLNYDQLADSPIMYGLPDTAMRVVGGADVLIGVYSPNNVISAKQIMNEASEILTASEKYLGGKLPVDKYAFIFYFTDTTGVSGGMGALEHKNSSVYFLPEIPIADIAPMLRDVCAHEFFHVVTPLNIHSEEIADFNFLEPTMSEHLWLYEGQTEYAAHHAQVKAGLITPEEFLQRMQEKILQSRTYYNDTLAFTRMSKDCLDTYKSEYGNVYQKGALINMCLDLELLHLSSGKYGTQQLMYQLGQEFGKNKAFEDDKLFDEITRLTYPEVRNFFSQYVEGNNALPYEQFFEYVGISISPPVKAKKITLGKVALNMNMGENGAEITVMDISNMNAFGQKVGYEVGDKIVKINKVDITQGNPSTLMDSALAGMGNGDKIILELARQTENGKTKMIKYKGKAMEVEFEIPGEVKFDENPTAEQLTVRNSWLGN